MQVNSPEFVTYVAVTWAFNEQGIDPPREQKEISADTGSLLSPENKQRQKETI